MAVFAPPLASITEEISLCECENLSDELLVKFADGELLRVVAKAALEYLPNFVAWFACRHCELLLQNSDEPVLLRRASTPVSDKEEQKSSRVECVCALPRLDQAQIVGAGCVYELSAQPDLFTRLDGQNEGANREQLEELKTFLGPLIRAKYKEIARKMVEEELEDELREQWERQSLDSTPAAGYQRIEALEDKLEELEQNQAVPDQTERSVDDFGEEYEEEDDSDRSYPTACNAMLERWMEPCKHVALTELMTQPIPKYCKHLWWHLKPEDQEKLMELFAESGTDYVTDFVDTFGCRHALGIEKTEAGSWQLKRRPETPFPYDAEGRAMDAPAPNCYCTAPTFLNVQTFGRSAVLELSANPRLADRLSYNIQDVHVEELLQHHLGVMAVRHILRWLSLDIQHRMQEREVAKVEAAKQLQRQWDQGGWEPEETVLPRSECWGDSSLQTWLQNVKPEYGLGDEE